MSSTVEYMTFSINGTKFGINTNYIDNVGSAGKVTKIPNTDARVDGLMIQRDQTIPVINLGSYLFNTKNESNEKSLVIVCDVKGIKIAFRIESIGQIERREDDSMLEVDAMLANREYMLDGFILDSDKGIVQVLDVKAIYSDISRLMDN